MLDRSDSWHALKNHAGNADSGDRPSEQNLFFKYSHTNSGFIAVDFSKQQVNSKTIELLLKLADEFSLAQWIERLFSGEQVNDTENRPALHHLLRRSHASSKTLPLDESLIPAFDNIQGELDKMSSIVDRINTGQWRGFSGFPVETVVNIGVGGSDLGPLMGSHALSEFGRDIDRKIDLQFVSTMDGSQFRGLLERLNPATTLFIIASKSFTTIDTMSNAETALEWLSNHSDVGVDLLFRRHFIGISENFEKMESWGIAPNSRLKIWDWVGGRYSVWSGMGLAFALKIGMKNFRLFLQGANAMDEHFQSVPLQDNIPVLLGLIGIWNSNFLNINSLAVLPYDGRLKHLPKYLEQLEMESNGKSVDRSGNRLSYKTCPIVWGEVGPDAQHAFYQLLHQGTEKVACDFILTAKIKDSENQSLDSQHDLAVANGLAQSSVLAFGDELDASEGLLHKKNWGGQPSTTILLDELTPYNFGQLIALYEHKVFVQSVIWNINPFDQWGVEYGKVVAREFLEKLNSERSDQNLDESTKYLISEIQRMRRNQSA